MSETRTNILNSAERALCQGGYGAFSFRSIANELNVKSAAIHYHFHTKNDLLVAVIDRYEEDFFGFIGDSQALQAFSRYTSAFLKALGEGSRSCLCGVLASEKSLLTEEMNERLNRFMHKNLEWLARCFEYRGYSYIEAQRNARLTFSCLEGAISFSPISTQEHHLKLVIEDLEVVFEARV